MSGLRTLGGGAARRLAHVSSSSAPRLARMRRSVAPDAVALTFDDGPMPGSTDRVLDVLGELDVHATFFCVGRNAREHPDLLARIRAEGHSIGSHSLTHPHPAHLTTAEVRRGSSTEGRRAVSDALGADTVLFRPPHGHLSLPSALVLRRLRLRPWLWTVDPEDWRPGATPGRVSEVASTAAAGDVVLLHDWVEQPWAPEALDRSATIAALPGVVRSIRKRGFRFATLPTG